MFAKTKDEYNAAAILFKEYAAWLNIDLCFQNFDGELLQLDKMYALPYGGIILCKDGDDFIACVGIRKIDDETAEMKRMWVKTSHQGKGIGSELLKRAMELAEKSGYKKIKLDTLNHMLPAINLYKKNGFIETPSYYNNPEPGAVFFEKLLEPGI